MYDTDNNLTRDLDQEITRQVLANQRFKSILEIGCGTGKNTVFLAQISGGVDALDFSQGMIDKAREKVKARNVRFDMADITKAWAYKSGDYDLVTCNLVLEHIEDLSHVFSEASRVLAPNGKFLINELHPFRQYQGTKARFERNEQIIEVNAFVHHISDFLNAASANGLRLLSLNEYWHENDKAKPPRLISFMFAKGSA